MFTVMVSVLEFISVRVDVCGTTRTIVFVFVNVPVAVVVAVEPSIVAPLSCKLVESVPEAGTKAFTE